VQTLGGLRGQGKWLHRSVYLTLHVKMWEAAAPSAFHVDLAKELAAEDWTRDLSRDLAHLVAGDDPHDAAPPTGPALPMDCIPPPPPDEVPEARRRRLSVSLERATQEMEATRIGVMKALQGDEGAPPEGETKRQRTRRLSVSLEKANEEMQKAQRQLVVAEALVAGECMDSIGYRGFVRSTLDLVEAQLRPAWWDEEVLLIPALHNLFSPCLRISLHLGYSETAFLQDEANDQVTRPLSFPLHRFLPDPHRNP
jgi:hypothetical protein